MMKDGRGISSALEFYEIQVNSVEFHRSNSYKSDVDGKNFKFKFDSEVFEGDDGELYKVLTTTEILSENPNDLKIALKMTGFFRMDKKTNLKEEVKDFMLEKNTLAIMFPYIRSYITNLTAQSGIDPIILPPININALVEQKNKMHKKD